MLTQRMTQYYPDQAAMGAKLTTKLEEFAFNYGHSFDSYNVTEPHYEYFWASQERGVVAFATRGRYVHAVGGLLAPENEKPILLEQFLAFCQANQFVVSLFNINDYEIPLFRKHHFQITKLGEDAMIPLPGKAWAGQSYEWVRRQANYCRRHGVIISELKIENAKETATAQLLQEMQEVSDLLLATKPQKAEMQIFEGHLEPDCLGRRRLFLARSQNGNGRIEGFLMCNPGLQGKQWSIEMYRHRPDGIRGVVPYLMLEALKQMEKEKIQQVSLCIIPGRNIATPFPGDSTLARWALILWGYVGNCIFDTRGLNQYKSRFRPECQSLYVCVYPKITLGSIKAFFRIWGVLNIDLRRTLIQLTLPVQKFLSAVIARIRRKNELSNTHEKAPILGLVELLSLRAGNTRNREYAKNGRAS